MTRMNMESISKFFELNGQALINSILLSEDSSGPGLTDGLIDRGAKFSQSLFRDTTGFWFVDPYYRQSSSQIIIFH